MTAQIVATKWGYSSLECDCTQTAIRHRVQSNGIGIYVIQCLSCGRQIRAVPKKSPEVLSLTDRTPFDEDLQLRWREKQQAFWQDQSAKKNRTAAGGSRSAECRMVEMVQPVPKNT